MAGSLGKLVSKGARSRADAYASRAMFSKREAWPNFADRSLRIGFLNPWVKAAESQAFGSLEIAARRIGVTLQAVTTSLEIEQAELDFVLAAASTQPKLTDIPTFGVVHEPRSRFLANPEMFANLLSYDGYLTISENLAQFCADISEGFGGYGETGFYYNSPQTDDRICLVESLARGGDLRLCYFGTNWDQRGRPLFRELCRRDYMRIYGPESAWDYLDSGYFGSPPFDGLSVQGEYYAHGAGLVLLSRDHLLDDVVSNRIFEISAVGAVSICPDIPWIRRHFLDAVYYYPPHGSVSEIVEAIDRAMEAIMSDPKEAADRAERARAVFESKFCAERLLGNAVAYYDRWRELLREDKRASDRAFVDVIMRVGEGRTAMIWRALKSIDAQTMGRFRVIFVKTRPADLSPFIEADWRRIADFVVVDEIGADRASALNAGFRAVSGAFFTVMDDADIWLSHRIRSLFEASRRLTPDRAYVYSGYLRDRDEIDESLDRGQELLRVACSEPAAGTIFEILGGLHMRAFLASSALLNKRDRSAFAPQELLLHAEILAHSEAAFSWRPSIRLGLSAEEDGVAHVGSPAELPFRCAARLGSRIERIERQFSSPSMLAWERLGDGHRKLLAAKFRSLAPDGGVLAFEEGMKVIPLDERADLESEEVSLSEYNCVLIGASRWLNDGGLEVLPVEAPWAVGAIIELPETARREGPHWAIFDFERVYGSFGLGVCNDRHEMVARTAAPILDGPAQLWLYIKSATSGVSVAIQNLAGASREPAVLRRVRIARAHEASSGRVAKEARASAAFSLADVLVGPAGKRNAAGVIESRPDAAGYLFYGPYRELSPGGHIAEIEVRCAGSFSLWRRRLVFDICTKQGERLSIRGVSLRPGARKATMKFTSPAQATPTIVEARAFLPTPADVAIMGLTIRRAE
ncbi:glycosyltransferase family A protein [Methylocystis sp.]|uniref:glycosyltransferase family A protein n=1 Tax=Methylocystis sp. TaxID=1911079 RepID=UPI003DA6148D